MEDVLNNVPLQHSFLPKQGAEMRDTDGSYIVGARLSDLEEIVMRYSPENTRFFLMFEGDGAMARAAFIYSDLSIAEEKAEKLRALNPGFAIRILPVKHPRG